MIHGIWTDLAVSMDTHFKNTSRLGALKRSFASTYISCHGITCWLDDHSGSQRTYNNYGERECYGESNVLCIK